MININNLHKSFDNKIVLNGLNLDIEKGSSSVIIGGSGTGKSVLIKCILGLIVPESGKIEINNKTIFDKGNYIHSNKMTVSYFTYLAMYILSNKPMSNYNKSNY